MVLVKIILFGVLLAFAWRNRFRLTPALSRDPEPAKRGLVQSILHETGLGLVIVLVASVLASLPPGMHMSMESPAVQQDLGLANSVGVAALDRLSAKADDVQPLFISVAPGGRLITALRAEQMEKHWQPTSTSISPERKVIR